MTATGTYSFSPSSADVTIKAFGLLQIRPQEITAEHLDEAAYQANMLMVDFANRNPQRWLIEQQTVELTDTATYTLEARTVCVTTAVLSTPGGSDRAIGPMSAADYSVVPQKDQTGKPSAFWFSLAIPPTITLWPVPDDATIDDGVTLNLLTFRQAQDVDLSDGQSVDCPYRGLDAFTTGLAARLAEVYRPEKEAKLNERYETRMAHFQKRDQESVPISIVPNFTGYFR
jgi:hypothetical protein